MPCSLDLSRKLKSAGLVWEPKRFDYFQMIVMENSLTTCLTDEWSVKSIRKETVEFRNKSRLWLPRLDQLLAEIEARGWEVDSVQHKGKYACDIAYLSDTVHTKYQTFAGETREDAAGLAYLWIMEQDAHV